jgi:hypothetical protein
VIKGMASRPDGTRILVLGLSGENVTRLAAGEPMHIAAAELAAMGFQSFEVVITYGKTDQVIVDQLRTAGLMPPGTPVHNACADPNCTQEHAR